MSDFEFYLKQGDTASAISIALEDSTASAITEDLTSATIAFYMRSRDGDILINGGAGTVVDNTAKIIKYQWQDGDTDIPASAFGLPHEAEFHVVYSDGRSQTFPNTTNILVHVHPKVAP